MESQHRAFLDFEALYFALTQYKNEKAWYNLYIDRRTLPALLKDSSWYRLFIPADLLNMGDFGRIALWQEIALALLKKYVERYLIFRKNEYEGPHLEYYTLQKTDDNFIKEYQATVERTETIWINKINELKNLLESRTFKEKWGFGPLQAFDFSRHLYQPLIHLDKNNVVQISPIPLNDGERDFVQDLYRFCIDFCRSAALARDDRGLKAAPTAAFPAPATRLETQNLFGKGIKAAFPEKQALFRRQGAIPAA